MTLMKLAPESVRLRRMAKAYAAGELSEADYRAARREVIDNFSTEPVLDDDTRRRWSQEEPTLRHGARTDPPASSAAEAVAAGGFRRWVWFALLGLVLTAALLALPDAMAAEGVHVPPVPERSPDPNRSPTLELRGVRVAWAGEAAMPADTLHALQESADQALAHIRAQSAPGPHGFTPRELTEVARFLDVLGVHEGEGGLDAADARDLSALIRGQKARRGVSVAQLEDVAEAVQVRMREHGYFLAAAYVPAQRLADGVARIDVLPGRLGDIVVEGGDPEPVVGTFSALMGQPLTLSDVSSRLQVLNSLPGVTAQASFGPGQEVGESRLRLNVLEQRDWVADIAVDNHGEDETGDQRLSVNGSWLNPRNAGDRLSAGALVTVNPSNQTYGYVSYDTPAGARYRLSARLGNNDFSHDGVRELDGEGMFLDLSARRSLSHGRTRGLNLVLAGARQTLDWDDGVDQTVTLLGAGLAGHRVLDGPQIAAEAAVSLSAGHIGGDRFAAQDANFWLLEVDSQAWMPISLPGLASLPGLEGEQKLRMRLAGQWSDSLLPATRRFALGGAGRARAFERSDFLADRGLLLGLEARLPVRLGEVVVFSEVGYGDARDPGEDPWSRLIDLGVGWEAELIPSLFSRVSWAFPLSTDGTGGIDDDGSRLYWSIRYAH